MYYYAECHYAECRGAIHWNAEHGDLFLKNFLSFNLDFSRITFWNLGICPCQVLKTKCKKCGLGPTRVIGIYKVPKSNGLNRKY